MSGMNIGVIGSGVAGLSAAWLLSRQHKVTVIEADTRLGGHANTVDVATPEGLVPIDTGFIVYNVASYPNLIALFGHLGVESAKSDMGFSVSLGGGAYEYSGRGALGLFGQPSNLINADHWRMTRDILRFFREANDFRATAADETVSLGAWLHGRGYSQAFVERHILPMAAAIWSAPMAELLAFPAAAFARFFANHGLLQVRHRPEWRTVVGGSRSYVDRLKKNISGSVIAGSGARRIRRDARGADVTFADGSVRRFDHVVLACHADDALKLIDTPTADERRFLGAFRYQDNTAVLHTDARFMPKRRRLWSSWNYIGHAAADPLCVSYWMNALQPLGTKTDYFVTLNPGEAVAPGHEIKRFSYAHPVFDAAALAAQRDLWTLQGQQRTWFAGSYFGSGFHEDALQAGLWAAETLGNVRRPWTVANESGRISVGPVPRVPVMADAAE